MLNKEDIARCVEQAIKSPDIFLVEVNVSADNRVTVELDSDHGMDVDTCVEISRAIEAQFSRDDEDYELEVGSAGLTAPFKVRRQYLKNVGNTVEVLTSDGLKLRGTLAEVADDTFTLRSQKKEKAPGQKRPVMVDVDSAIPFASVKKAVLHLEF